MTIHNNLRQLRRDCGMTQEQAAERVGITRQALSSYETGRTRPDVDMLIQLAEIYGTSLEDILYGQERKLKAAHRIRMTAFILLGVLTLLTIVSSSFQFIANRYFPVSEGLVSADEFPILETHLWFSRARQTTDTLSLTVAFLGFALLLILLVTGNNIIQNKAKLKYAAILSAAILAIATIFGLIDPVYTVTQYITTPVLIIAQLALFLLADVIIGHFQKQVLLKLND